MPWGRFQSPARFQFGSSARRREAPLGCQVDHRCSCCMQASLTPVAVLALGAIGLGAWTGHLNAVLLCPRSVACLASARERYWPKIPRTRSVRVFTSVQGTGCGTEVPSLGWPDYRDRHIGPKIKE